MRRSSMPLRAALVTLPLCLAACQHTPAPARAPAQARPPTVASSKRDRYITLGELRSRDRVIVIQSGPNGPAYTVKSQDGTTLANHLSESEILARFPELGDAIAEGFMTADSRHPSPDASVDVPRPQGHTESRTLEPMSLTPQR